eukprot:918109-Amphidinium_carterae.1
MWQLLAPEHVWSARAATSSLVSKNHNLAASWARVRRGCQNDGRLSFFMSILNPSFPRAHKLQGPGSTVLPANPLGGASLRVEFCALQQRFGQTRTYLDKR